MIHIPDISKMVVRRNEMGAEPITIRCIGGHARWIRMLGTVILQADIIIDSAAETALAYLGSHESRFDLEISYSSHGQNATLIGTQFFGCAAREVSGRDFAIKPYGQPCRRYQMTISAENSGSIQEPAR
jgi:hypothetical protein